MTKLEELSQALEEFKAEQDDAKAALAELEPRLMEIATAVDEWARSLRRPRFIEVRCSTTRLTRVIQIKDITEIGSDHDNTDPAADQYGMVLLVKVGEKTFIWDGGADELLDAIGCVRPKPAEQEDPDSGDLIG